jgi:excisionase family DNA binding protein
MAGLEEQAEERLWRAEQVAQRFEVSRSKVFQLLAEGQLRSVRIGGSRRIPESAVRDFLAGLEPA